MGWFITEIPAPSQHRRDAALSNNGHGGKAQGTVAAGLLLSLLLWLALPLLSGCSQEQRLERILAQQKLVVVTRNAPTTFYEGRDGMTGLEYDLVTAFADSLGVEVEFISRGNLAEIIALVASGEADLAAAGLTRTAQRQTGFLFSEPYQQVEQQVVCRRGGARPQQAADLVGLTLQVPAHSSYVERLRQLRDELPELHWEEDAYKDTEYLLEQVWREQLDCTVGDSNIVAINRRYMPELSVQFALNEPEDLAWMLPRDARGLQRTVNRWLGEFEADGELQQLINKYYGYIEVFDYVDTRSFKRRIENRLPRYEDWFREAGEQYGLDWSLLAAQAYQESHWNPRARSPTGVRGIMMLTLTTAGQVGVESRLDPRQSIFGGARYLADLRQRLPESITEPDRTWIALAAYNVGMGHVYDARGLARGQDRNPDLWHDLREVLPLLSQPQYYRELRHGYARGSEPVRYVERIRDYHDMLLRSLSERERI